MESEVEEAFKAGYEQGYFQGKVDVNSEQENNTPTEDKLIVNGVELVQSIRFHPQKMYFHPFALSKFVTNHNGLIDFHKGKNPDPLTETEQKVIDSAKNIHADPTKGEIK